MSKINLSFKESFLVSDEQFFVSSKRLEPYLAQLREVVFNKDYSKKEAFLNLVNEDSLYEEVVSTAENFSNPRLKYIFVVGIGGSNLGAMAIYNALGMDKKLSQNKKLIFLDTNNSNLIEDTLELIKKSVFFSEEFVLNVISKSGSTTETIVNFEIIYKALLDQIKGDEGELAKRIIVTTDKDSKLWYLAEEKNFNKITIPEQVGGRYSVFSAVGLLPLFLAGVDIKQLIAGAREVLNECLLDDNVVNPALISAISMYVHSTNNKNIINTFVFNAQLETFGKWYSQLIGESIGKEFDRDGKNVNVGVTPIVSVGSTDLHSVGQLFLGGPKDKFTFFIHSLSNSKINIPKELISNGILPIISGKDIHQIMRAILDGTKEAYRKRNLPFIDINLPEISPFYLGVLFQIKMIEVILLADLYNIDAFDQPNVEAYKIETKKILNLA